MIKNARLICCAGTSCSPLGIQYDTTTGLVVPPVDDILSQLSAMEAKLGLPSDPSLNPQQRVDRLAAAIKAVPLSSGAVPDRRPTRWTDSRGKSQVDLAAVFDNEAASAK